MPRLGKKTLYLDLEALDRLQAALQRLPGRPSVSSYLNEQLPMHAQNMEEMVEAMEQGGLRGLAAMFQGSARMLAEFDADITKALEEAKNPDKTLSEIAADVPPKKPRKPSAKKVVKT